MVTIIGAGPAGCATGYLLAKQGLDVDIYEDHATVGEPVQCTGIVTADFTKFVRLRPEFLVNKIKNVRIYSPNGKNIAITFKKPDLIIDRWAFDNHLADKATDAGAKLINKARFMRFSKNGAIIKRNGKIISDIGETVIGADGPNSQVAKSAGIFGKREFLTGIQATVKIENDNAVEFYPYIGTFGWVVPENTETARVGILGRGKTVLDFKRLLKLKGITENQIIEKQGGVVPIYNRGLKTAIDYYGKKIYLVGDAATQVKATTGGGVIQGLIAAKELAHTIIYRGDYERAWKSKLGRDLWMHGMARKVMDRFNPNDWNRLIEIFNEKKNKDVLAKMSRDDFSKLVLKIGLQEPRVWGFAKRLFF